MTSACNDNVALTKKKKDVGCDRSEARLQKVKMDKGSKSMKATFWNNLDTSDLSLCRGKTIYSNTHTLTQDLK